VVIGVPQTERFDLLIFPQGPNADLWLLKIVFAANILLGKPLPIVRTLCLLRRRNQMVDIRLRLPPWLTQTVKTLLTVR
jgi:hypothetical protein